MNDIDIETPFKVCRKKLKKWFFIEFAFSSQVCGAGS